MDQVIGPLATTLLAVSAAVQIAVAILLWKILQQLGRIGGPPIQSNIYTPLGGVLGSAAGYAIFVYRAGRWVLEEDLSAPGYEPSAPNLEGSYEGQVIKKESSPAR